MPYAVCRVDHQHGGFEAQPVGVAQDRQPQRGGDLVPLVAEQRIRKRAGVFGQLPRGLQSHAAYGDAGRVQLRPGVGEQPVSGRGGGRRVLAARHIGAGEGEEHGRPGVRRRQRLGRPVRRREFDRRQRRAGQAPEARASAAVRPCVRGRFRGRVHGRGRASVHRVVGAVAPRGARRLARSGLAPRPVHRLVCRGRTARRAALARHPPVAPLLERDQHREQRLARVGEQVLVTGRAPLVEAAAQHPAGDERAEPLGEQLAGQPQLDRDRIEADPAAGHFAQHQDVPPVARHDRGPGDAARRVGVVHLHGAIVDSLSVPTLFRVGTYGSPGRGPDVGRRT